MVLAPGAQPDGGFALPNGGSDGLSDLERKAHAVLDRAAVFVRALVRHVLDELVDQVPVRAVDLDAVKAGAMDRVLCGRSVPLDVFLDLCRAKGGEKRVETKGRVGRLPSLVKARGTSSGLVLSAIGEDET